MILYVSATYFNLTNTLNVRHIFLCEISVRGGDKNFSLMEELLKVKVEYETKI